MTDLVQPEGWGPGMRTMSKRVDHLAGELERNAAHQRGHLIGFSSPGARRVRHELERMHRQARADAAALHDMAAWLQARSHTLEQEQQDYIRHKKTWR